ncbi:MAG: hypothetical protein JOZ89_07730 [Gammaproteobacteria bacterium]|nr:hypothetical protein [Gammaproteobacteria bacterium]
MASPQDEKGVRGYAHVIREDTLDRSLLFLGTEFGLWISVDGGTHWAQFKGGHFPAAAVRDLVIQPRDNDLVVATHGRGIWIIDDITPLRHLTPELLSEDAAFVSSRPVQQRIEATGGWPNGAAAFVGENPKNGAVINYYLRTRQLYGKLKLEVLDKNGAVIDELPASSHRGLNRAVWTMHRKAPHVPPGAQIAFSGTQGARVPPGTYTVRLLKADKSYETRLPVGLDTRVTWSVADRQAQYAAAMKLYDLFADETALFARIAGLRAQVATAKQGRKAGDALAAKLDAFDGKLDGLRKQIVATTEGGAITGEERLREHSDQLYAAIISWDGPPTNYQLDNIGGLRSQLEEVSASFAKLTEKELPALNRSLEQGGAKPLAMPPATAFEDEPAAEHGSGGVAARFDAEEAAVPAVPKDLRLWN